MNDQQQSVYDIYFNIEGKYIVMDWNGYATSEQFRAGSELMLDFLVKYKTDKVLADTSNMVLIAAEDQDWIIEDFLPRAINAGFKAIALIKPESYFNQVALNLLAERIKGKKLKLRMFDNDEQASEWLSAI